MKQILVATVVALLTAASTGPSLAKSYKHQGYMQSYGYEQGYSSVRGRDCAPVYDSAGVAVACR